MQIFEIILCIGFYSIILELFVFYSNPFLPIVCSIMLYTIVVHDSSTPWVWLRYTGSMTVSVSVSETQLLAFDALVYTGAYSYRHCKHIRKPSSMHTCTNS